MFSKLLLRRSLGKYDEVILPKKEIQESFNAKGAHIYFAEIDGVRVGGIVVVIDSKLIATH